MATATVATPANAQTGLLSAALKSVKLTLVRRAKRIQVENELHRLTDRELNDIGIHRGMIREIASRS